MDDRRRRRTSTQKDRQTWRYTGHHRRTVVWPKRRFWRRSAKVRREAEQMTASTFSIYTVKSSSTEWVKTQLLGRAYTLMFRKEKFETHHSNIFSWRKIALWQRSSKLNDRTCGNFELPKYTLVPFPTEHSTQQLLRAESTWRTKATCCDFKFHHTECNFQTADDCLLSENLPFGVKVTANQFRSSSESSQRYGFSLTGQSPFCASRLHGTTTTLSG